MIRINALLGFSLLFVLSIEAQESNTWSSEPEFILSGFTDVFYAYDLDQPQGDQRQSFLFNHNRHNEFNLNLGLINLGTRHTKYRSNFTLQAGTYANDNYAAEPGLLKNIFEANVGVSLNEKNNLWLDAGILPSHLGFESALSIDNMTLTRSLSAESSPYFLAGAKLSFRPSDKWDIAALIVNGWQRIRRVAGNSIPSYGTQVSFSPSDKTTINWSTFIGTDDPDSTRRMRYFSNLFGQFQIAKKIRIIAGIDVGYQQIMRGSTVHDMWFCPTIIGQYEISSKWKTAIRAEYYHDESGVIIPTGTTNGFQTSGLSVNLDYCPTHNIMCRVEGRLLNSRDRIFEDGASATSNNFFVAGSMAIKLDEIKIN